MIKQTLRKVSATVVVAAALAAPSAHAQDLIYGIGGTGFNPSSLSLVSFFSDSPGTFNSSTSITGITSGFSLQAIDFRPATLELYGLAYSATNTAGNTANAQLYVIDPASGVATARGSLFNIGSAEGGFGLSIGVGFNPAVDLLRVVTGTNGNFRINPDTGGIVTTGGADAGVAYASGDPNAGNSYQIADVDYTTDARLFDIDYINNVLARQAPPNAGTLTTIGDLGITLQNGTEIVGFDIGPTDTAFLSGGSTDDGAENRTRLFTVNLADGSTSTAGLIGSDPNFVVRDVAVMVPEPATWLMMGVGAAMLLGVNRIRRRS